MHILEIKNISLNYYDKTTETPALKDVSFDIDEGDFVAIVGPSGCGKTTLLSLISGIIKPTSGKIFLKGKEINGVNNNIGYMLQRDHLFEWRNIQKNIQLGLEVQKKLNEKSLKKIDDLLTKYGLKEFSKSFPNQLSGGMRQRVALIRTLALDPDILLLDEPFSALDFQTRLNVCDDVYSIIKKEQITTILVTHDISEAISLADKIVILTQRPATVKRIHYTNLAQYDSPLNRRKSPDFSKQFEKIWKELNSNETTKEFFSTTQTIY